MTKLFKTLAASALVAFVASGCASGPQYKDVAASIPTLKEAQGRIYFYRANSMFGAALQPHVYVNDQPVGKSQPGGFFYVDEPAGDYVVSTRTETKKTVSFHLDAGETKYVKTSVGFGLLVGRIIPTLESTDDATRDIVDLHYIGEPTTAASN
ncbi:hypothetical protein P3T18_006096 [Paraburkholderia sp. GAS199]|uniref:DUF2846 domain-containing protein n=1 Tax=Paraburkholderia sp. GAS199 TaxID=3035126 RepID=UPI003D1EAAD9